jgi:hypothetical protein
LIKLPATTNDPGGLEVPTTAADIARRVANKLSPESDSSLPAAVEAELANGTAGRYLDPVSLGALIVSAASLAWTIYKDTRSKAANPSADVISRQVRVQLSTPVDIPTDLRDRIIDIAVAESMAQPDASDGQ